MLKIDKKNIFVYIAVILLLVFLYFIGILKPVESVFLKIFNPVIKELYFVSSDLRFRYGEQEDKNVLLDKIEQLESDVVRLTEENVGYKTVEEENISLREHLMFLESTKYNYILSLIH